MPEPSSDAPAASDHTMPTQDDLLAALRDFNLPSMSCIMAASAELKSRFKTIHPILLNQRDEEVCIAKAALDEILAPLEAHESEIKAMRARASAAVDQKHTRREAAGLLRDIESMTLKLLEERRSKEDLIASLRRDLQLRKLHRHLWSEMLEPLLTGDFETLRTLQNQLVSVSESVQRLNAQRQVSGKSLCKNSVNDVRT